MTTRILPWPHGTTTGYRSRGCRCEACREAHRLTVREESAARKARGLSPDDPRHGKTSTYTNWGCRCDACTRANSSIHRCPRCGWPETPSPRAAMPQPARRGAQHK